MLLLKVNAVFQSFLLRVSWRRVRFKQQNALVFGSTARDGYSRVEYYKLGEHNLTNPTFGCDIASRDAL